MLENQKRVIVTEYMTSETGQSSDHGKLNIPGDREVNLSVLSDLHHHGLLFAH